MTPTGRRQELMSPVSSRDGSSFKPINGERRRSSVINRRISASPISPKPRSLLDSYDTCPILHGQLIVLAKYLGSKSGYYNLYNSNIAFRACLLAELSFRKLCYLEFPADSKVTIKPGKTKINIVEGVFTGDKVLDNIALELRSGKCTIDDWVYGERGRREARDPRVLPLSHAEEIAH